LKKIAVLQPATVGFLKGDFQSCIFTLAQLKVEDKNKKAAILLSHAFALQKNNNFSIPM